MMVSAIRKEVSTIFGNVTGLERQKWSLGMPKQPGMEGSQDIGENGSTGIWSRSSANPPWNICWIFQLQKKKKKDNKKLIRKLLECRAKCSTLPQFTKEKKNVVQDLVRGWGIYKYLKISIGIFKWLHLNTGWTKGRLGLIKAAIHHQVSPVPHWIKVIYLQSMYLPEEGVNSL